MTYKDTVTATFLSRPNRFIAHVEVEGTTEIAHVKNTGRCKELLIPGAQVILQRAQTPERKTAFDLIAVWKARRLINMDSQAPNKVFLEYLRSGRYAEGITLIKPEARRGDSRFDFYVEVKGEKIFIEVKGVTLEEDGVAMFPDAPTERGIKHLVELSRWALEGHPAAVVFVIQMKGISHFTPNVKTHRAFAEALIAANRAGVKVAAYDCTVTEDSLNIGNPVEVVL